MRRWMPVIALLVVTGCAAQAPPRRVWTATRPDAPPLEQARARCEQEAVSRSGAAPTQAQGLAASASGGIFIQCMRKAGWELKTPTE